MADHIVNILLHSLHVNHRWATMKQTLKSHRTSHASMLHRQQTSTHQMGRNSESHSESYTNIVTVFHITWPSSSCDHTLWPWIPLSMTTHLIPALSLTHDWCSHVSQWTDSCLPFILLCSDYFSHITFVLTDIDCYRLLSTYGIIFSDCYCDVLTDIHSY